MEKKFQLLVLARFGFFPGLSSRGVVASEPFFSKRVFKPRGFFLFVFLFVFLVRLFALAFSVLFSSSFSPPVCLRLLFRTGR